MVVNFRGDQIFVDFVRFLIHEVLFLLFLVCLLYLHKGTGGGCSYHDLQYDTPAGLVPSNSI